MVRMITALIFISIILSVVMGVRHVQGVLELGFKKLKHGIDVYEEVH